MDFYERFQKAIQQKDKLFFLKLFLNILDEIYKIDKKIYENKNNSDLLKTYDQTKLFFKDYIDKIKKDCDEIIYEICNIYVNESHSTTLAYIISLNDIIEDIEKCELSYFIIPFKSFLEKLHNNDIYVLKNKSIKKKRKKVLEFDSFIEFYDRYLELQTELFEYKRICKELQK